MVGWAEVYEVMDGEMRLSLVYVGWAVGWVDCEAEKGNGAGLGVEWVDEWGQAE